MCPAASPPARLPAQLPGAPSPADPRERTLRSPFLGRLCSPVHTLVRDACGFRFLQPFSTWSRRVGGPLPHWSEGRVPCARPPSRRPGRLSWEQLPPPGPSRRAFSGLIGGLR